MAKQCGSKGSKMECRGAIIHSGAFAAAADYGPAVSLIHRLHDSDVKLAVYSGGGHDHSRLREAGLIRYFQAIVDGDARSDQDTRVRATEEIGIDPYDCMVLEHSEAGVAAARRGNFGLVVGLASDTSADRLYAQGADMVVVDPAELTIAGIETWFAETRQEEAWKLRYYGFEPEEERLREALTTVGNGYFGSRGACEGEDVRGNVHYPGTYIAGIYNRTGSEVHGKTIYNNDFVNCPNWLGIEVRVENGTPLNPSDCEVLDYAHVLDMRNGLLVRTLTLRDEARRVTTLESRRFASLDDAHLGAIQLTIRPLNYSGTVTMRSRLDGTVYNYGVERYRELSSKHLEPISSGEVAHVDSQAGEDKHVYLHVKTVQSDIKICMNAVSRFFTDGERVFPDRQVTSAPGLVTELFTMEVEQGQEYTYEKSMGLFTSAPWDADSPELAALHVVDGIARFNHLLQQHARVWAEYWDRADLIIEGDRFAQKAMRLHVYHLLSTANPGSTFVDWGLPARGLHGEAYRGHIFWDELFISPFYNLRFPTVTRNHLMYRYRRLEAARTIARDEQFSGALYPWQSADDGTRDSQTLHYNPNSGEWDPDLTYLQRHINISVAYSIWQYVDTTGDAPFMDEYGMEMLLEICRFWADIARFDEDDRRYHIRKAVGPDEFHTQYPESDDGGLDDNAYTNIMACWILQKTAHAFRDQTEAVKQSLYSRLNFDEGELEVWDDIAGKMYVPIRGDGLIEQFSGWMDRLDELDWDAYRSAYDNIRRLDRILKAEGLSPSRYKAIKQADVLQCFYMLSPEKVSRLLTLMGYEAGDAEQLFRTNYEYYTARTSHGSTLSYVVHSSIANYASAYERDAWNWFTEALQSDIYDTQGGTTLEGIHCGVMAGTTEIVVRSFAGVRLYNDRIELEPRLPRAWRRLSFTVVYQGTTLKVNISPGHVYASQLIDGHEHEMECSGDGARFLITLS